VFDETVDVKDVRLGQAAPEIAGAQAIFGFPNGKITFC